MLQFRISLLFLLSFSILFLHSLSSVMIVERGPCPLLFWPHCLKAIRVTFPWPYRIFIYDEDLPRWILNNKFIQWWFLGDQNIHFQISLEDILVSWPFHGVFWVTLTALQTFVEFTSSVWGRSRYLVERVLLQHSNYFQNQAKILPAARRKNFINLLTYTKYKYLYYQKCCKSGNVDDFRNFLKLSVPNCPPYESVNSKFL